MLCLSRKAGQGVVIAGGIEVTVESVRGGKVSLGFKAPKDLVIHRREVYERIASEQRSEIEARDRRIRPAADAAGGAGMES